MSYRSAVAEPSSETAPGSGPEVAATPEATGFHVKLVNFEGPFDLLLQLIAKHKLDVTELALHRVTDDFIVYIRAMGKNWDLDEASEFLIIAATLLDLKAARLLQYRAFKEAAAHIAALEAAAARRYPRSVSMEPRFADLLPELVLGIGPDRLAALAVKAMTPKPVPTVSISHVHDVKVSVREHANILRDRLVRLRTATFRALCADCANTLEVVARFLALLELYREGLVGFEQVQALGELTVRWTAGDDDGSALKVDEYAGTTEPAAQPVAQPAAQPVAQPERTDAPRDP